MKIFYVRTEVRDIKIAKFSSIKYFLIFKFKTCFILHRQILYVLFVKKNDNATYPSSKTLFFSQIFSVKNQVQFSGIKYIVVFLNICISFTSYGIVEDLTSFFVCKLMHSRIPAVLRCCVDHFLHFSTRLQGMFSTSKISISINV